MILSVKNLNVRFEHDAGITKAVDGVDFVVNENEVLGLVGESGSGKTATALAVMGLLPRRRCFMSGEILKKGKAAMIFQEPFTSLNPVMKVGLQLDEASGSRAETLKFLEKVKMHDPERIYNSYPHQLSGGQRQRAVIAMAISLRPKLLIADEPTTSLDVTIQAEILELILNLREELRMSVIFITHDFGIIGKVADRVLVMKEGKTVESGKKEQILYSPKNDYTRKLLNAIAGIAVQPETERKGKTNEAVKVRDLSKSFSVEKGIFKRKTGVIEAVRKVSLVVEEGKTLGLVGESGSGKTTLGKLLIGLLKPDSGEVIAVPASMQIVFQDPHSSLDPRMRIEDIILEGLTVKGVKRAEKEKVLKDVLFKVRLDYSDRHKYPHQFSGGQKQRVAIARALAVNPRIIILDEPVSSLDVITQMEILDLLRELQGELRLTYIFISHDLRVVEYMSDDVAVMRDGKIVEFAPKYRIYSSPKHPYTKKLLSSIPQI